MSTSTKTSRIKIILFNKYLITCIIFFTYLTFFDKHNLISRVKSSQKISELEAEAEFYKNQIQMNKEKMNELQSNTNNLEKFAREQYLMRKANEDIFIIKE
jgi:cell division protein DivIC